MASVLDILPDSGASFGTTSPQEDAGRPLGLVDKILAAFGHSVANGVMAPGRALASKVPITSDQMVAPAMDLTSMLTLGAGAAPSEANSLRMGIKAYHGSPHDFDKFDLSKIGTGEGAQAYGHGLYFADNEGVAKSYRDALSPGYEMRAGGKEYNSSDPAHLAAHHLDMFGKRGFPREEIAARLREDAFLGDRYTKAADLIDSGAALPEFTRVPAGKMYEVNINADPAHFLDWDKPLKDQHSAVREKLTPEALGLKPAGPMGERGYYGYVDDKGRLVGRAQTGKLPEIPFPESETPASLVRGMGTWKPDEGAAALNRAGIPGIKYLDQGSRGPATIYNVGAPTKDFGPYTPFTTKADAEAHADMLRRQGFADAEIKTQAQPQSSNYVVFNDKLIDIMRKYGLAGMLGGAGLSQMPQDRQ